MSDEKKNEVTPLTEYQAEFNRRVQKIISDFTPEEKELMLDTANARGDILIYMMATAKTEFQRKDAEDALYLKYRSLVRPPKYYPYIMDHRRPNDTMVDKITIPPIMRTNNEFINYAENDTTFTHMMEDAIDEAGQLSVCRQEQNKRLKQFHENMEPIPQPRRDGVIRRALTSRKTISPLQREMLNQELKQFHATDKIEEEKDGE